MLDPVGLPVPEDGIDDFGGVPPMPALLETPATTALSPDTPQPQLQGEDRGLPGPPPQLTAGEASQSSTVKLPVLPFEDEKQGVKHEASAPLDEERPAIRQ